MSSGIVPLVASYLAAVHNVVGALQARMGSKSILRAVREDDRLKVGRLDSNTEYAFHGIGCRVTSGDNTIDFEFGPNGSVGGFDPWRLWLFAGGNPVFQQWQDRAEIERALQELEIGGLIERRGLQPSPQLFYLTPAGEDVVSAAIR